MKTYLKPFFILLPIISLVAYYLVSLSNRSEFNDEGISEKKKVNSSYLNLSLEKIVDWNGISIELKSVKDPLIVMHFWASWCGPCIHEFPDLIKMAKNQNGKVQVFAISEDKNKDEIRSFIKSFKDAEATPNFHIVWDDEHKIMNEWEVTKLPESFIYGPKRKLMKRVSGVVNWTSQDTADFFNMLQISDEEKK